MTQRCSQCGRKDGVHNSRCPERGLSGMYRLPEDAHGNRAALSTLTKGRGTLSQALDLTDAKQPPTEFRIFRAGENDTTKGVFLFDDAAAKAVMAAAESYGNEYSVDYNHAMLGASDAPDPAEAGKAAGWFKLALRDGELWAVDVRWTPAAAEKLTSLEYRFISPTFDYVRDGDVVRVVEMLNVALTNIPATKDLTPLMASRLEPSMTPEQIAKLARLLKLPKGATPEQALAKLDGLSFGDISDRLDAAISDKYSKADPDDATVTIRPWIRECFADSCVFEMAGQTFQVPYSVNGDDVALTGDAVEVVQQWKPIADEPGEPDGDEPQPNAPPATNADVPADMPPAAMARLAKEAEALAKEKAETAKLRAELDGIKTAALAQQFETEAAGLKFLAQEPKKLGGILLSLHRKAPDEQKAVSEILQKANAALAQSGLFEPAGIPGSPEGEGARAKLDRLAKEFRASPEGKELTDAQALDRVMQKYPQVYAAAQAERAAEAA